MRKMDNIWDEFNKIELIGLGSFSKVYRAKSKLNDKYVAIKEINKSNMNNNDILNEIEIMKKLENSVLLIESIESQDSYYLILELCNISLEEYLKNREKPLSIDEIKEVLLDLNKSFKEMKDKNIIHRDLKPSNILLSLNKSKINKISFKISDFGLNKLIEGSKIDEMSLKGSPITMSPEILNGKENLISNKSDIWSLGIIIYYMLNNKYPYQGLTESAIYKDICSNKKLDKTDDEDLNDLVNKMLIVDLKDRISWDNYFEHPFFKKTFSQNFPVFDFLCKKHMKTIYYYCKNCQLNICEDCKNQHDNHILIPFHEIGFTNEEINQINFLNNEIKTNFNKFNKIKNEINSLIDQIKLINKNNEIYQNDSSNNYKKYLIDCLVNVNKKIEIKPNILLFNLKQDKKEEKFQNYKSSLLQNNTLTINYHKDEINHLLQLQDGRLISCSDDYSINIYETNTFGLQISIKEHSSWIPSFTELKDGRIISCSGDNTFKIMLEKARQF